MKRNKKWLLVLFLICFLLQASVLYAGDFTSIDSFLTKKSQVIKQWMNNVEQSFERFQTSLKQGSWSFKGIFTDGDYWEKMKKSFDDMVEGQRGKIEDFKKDYDKAVGIHEM